MDLGKLNSVTTNGEKNMYDSKTSVAGQIFKKVMQTCSETLTVFHCTSPGGTMLPNFVNERCYEHCYFNSDLHLMQQFDLSSVPGLSGRNWNTVL
jgi:hypothetical protein